MSTNESFRMSQLYTDHTITEIDGKVFTKVGTLREWAAYIKAGYIVNSTLRPVKGNPATYALTMVAPELGRYVAMLRDEELEMDTTPEDYLEYANRHADFFASKRYANR